MSNCNSCKGCQKDRCFLCHSTESLTPVPGNKNGVFFCAKCVEKKETHYAFKCVQCGGHGFVEKNPETKAEIEGWLGASLSDGEMIIAEKGCQLCDPDEGDGGPHGNA